MDIVVDGWAWLPKSDLTIPQIVNMKDMLTVRPIKAPDFPGGEPDPILLFVDSPTHLGVPRAFYQRHRRSGVHNTILKTSDGSDSWKPAPFVGTLRPEQLSAKSKVVAQLQAGVLGGVVVAKPGWGKTVCALSIIAELKVPALIVVHKSFLVDQWAARIKQFMPEAEIGVVQQDTCDFEGKTVVIGMVHSLSGRAYPPELYSWAGIVITDESLGEGAKVLTREGWQAIGSLVERDEGLEVLAFDVRAGVFEWKRVTRRWCHSPRSSMLRVTHERGVIECTANHELLTPFGYVRAQELVAGVDCVIHCDRVETRRHAKRSTVADRRVHDRGRVLVTNQKGRQGSVSGASFSEAGGTSGCKVRCSGAVCSYPSEDGGKSRLGKGGSLFQHTFSSESFGASAEFISERSARSQCAMVGRELVQCGDGVVDYGRRFDQSEESSDDAAYGGYELCEGAGVSRMVDRSSTGPCCGDVGQESEVSGVVSGSGGCSGRGEGCRSVCDHVDAVQGRSSIETVDEGLCSLRRTYPKENGRALRTAKVLRRCGMSKGSTGGSVGSFSRKLRRDSEEIQNKRLCSLRRVDRYDGTIVFNEGGLFRSLPSGEGDTDCSEELLRGGEGVVDFHSSASKVIRVEMVETPKFVYDLTVEDHNNFVVDGIVAHNCHRISARTWCVTPQKFTAKYRLGFTATPRRKDGTEAVFWEHIGGILFSGKEERLKPKIKRVWTKFSFSMSDRFNNMLMPRHLVMRFLCADRPRNRLIIDKVMDALVARRKCLVVSERLAHLHSMEAILGSSWGPDRGNAPTVGFYVGGMSKTALAKSAEAQLIFATSQFVSEALDIPELDTLFLTTPLSDVEQLCGRILRPHRDKKDPIVVDFRDDSVPMLAAQGRKRDKVYQGIV